MLISGSEPERLKALGTVSGASERYGCDILLTVGKQLTGIQRKKFPEDFMSSLADGRLMTQLQKMGPLHRKLLVLEGYGQWTLDGELVGMRAFAKHQMFGLIFSLAFEFGVEVLRVKDMAETIDLLEELEIWAGKEKHTSLLSRPGPPKDGWGREADDARGMHILQGFPGIGPNTAAAIITQFGRVPLEWTVKNADELQSVPGIGKGRANKLWEALNDPKTKS